MKLNAEELREINEHEAKSRLKSIKRRPVYFILEDILDTYNIGGLYRLADALMVEKIYLCARTATPPNNRIFKASVGTDKIVPWEYCTTVGDAIKRLRSQYLPVGRHGRQKVTSNVAAKRYEQRKRHRNHSTGIQIVAIEQDKRSIDYRKVSYSLPIAFVIGNESDGVSSATLKLVDRIVEIPMWGVNKSLNVIISAAIVSYHVAAFQ